MSKLVEALRLIHITADAACRQAICRMVLNTSTAEDIEAAHTLAAVVLLMDSLIEEQTSVLDKGADGPMVSGEKPMEPTADFSDDLLSLEFRLRSADT